MPEINILVVDDEKEIADLIEIYLVSDGYKVFKAENAAKGLELLEKQEIHLVQMCIRDSVEISVMDSATLSTAIRDCTGTTYLVTSATNATTGDPDHGLFVYKGSDCNTNKDQKAFDMIAAAVQEYDLSLIHI